MKRLSLFFLCCTFWTLVCVAQEHISIPSCTDCTPEIATLNCTSASSNNTEIFTTKYESLYVAERNSPKIISLEALNGIYSIYVDGILTESTTIDVQGNEIGLFAWRYGDQFFPTEASFSFDNVIVREFR